MRNGKGSPAGEPDHIEEGSAQGQYFITATGSLQERRPRSLKHGDTFALFDQRGDAVAAPGSPDGLYHCDTRYLSWLQVKIGGARPLLLSSTLRDDNAMLTCDLTNPDLSGEDGELDHDLIHVRRSCFLWDRSCFQRFAIRNFDQQPRRVRIELAFAADFADLFELRGTRRERRGWRHAPVVGDSDVVLGYTGLDGKLRETCLSFEPSPVDTGSNRAVFEFDLHPQQRSLLFVEVTCDRKAPAGGVSRRLLTAMRDCRRAHRRLVVQAGEVETSNQIVNEAVRRAVSDFYTLVTETKEGPYPYAGIPWFSTVFGRDGLIAAFETLWLDPSIARGVLRYLAANQATEPNAAADAEPGKILHEVRRGEMAELGEVPFRRYYGSVDATPLFAMLAGAYFERTGDAETCGQLWPNIQAALSWIETHGDRDRDGFVEYFRQTSDGLVNQGWKDSYDSVFHADGRLAHGPIALVEVQAYVHGAFRSAALIARALGHARRATELDLKADRLAEAFDEAFFDEELGTFVLALDGEKKPCRVRASNAGHALFAGIAKPERARAVVRTLMERTSFSGWGIRTIDAREPRYNPMSYHNGSVWPHDNALIAEGFARYGFREEAARVFEAIFGASLQMDLRRLPELFCGFPRQRGTGPTAYPVACSPQAWAAGAPLSLVRSVLGLVFDRDSGRVRFNRPILPDLVHAIELHGLWTNAGSLDVAVRRSDAEVAVHILGRRDGARVVTET
jgi:glycogen debranching enzyme